MNQPSPSRTRRDLRALLPVGAIGTISGALLIAGSTMVVPSRAVHLPCWVLPNKRVLVIPGDHSCPLQLHDQVGLVYEQSVMESESSAALVLQESESASRAIPLEVRRNETSFRTTIEGIVFDPIRRGVRTLLALLVASWLLFVPLLLVQRSRSNAAPALVILYTAVALVAVAAISGRESVWLLRLALISTVMLPAALVHLSLCFPKSRPLLCEVPQLVVVPYALCGLLVPTGLFALEHSSLLWPAFFYLVQALIGGSWLVLIASCVFAIRESGSSLERARARLLAVGALLLPLFPTAAILMRHSSGAGGLAAFVWISVISMQFPIALAIARYDLFHLDHDLRHWAARLAYGASASMVLFVVFLGSRGIEQVGIGRDPAVFALAAFGCVLVMEPLRAWVLGLLEMMVLPRFEELRRIRAELQGVLRDGPHPAETVAGAVARALEDAFSPARGSVVLARKGSWEPIASFGGQAAPESGAVDEALYALGSNGIRNLADGEVKSRREILLTAAGISVVAGMDASGSRLGLVLLSDGERTSPYSTVELEFVWTIACLAGEAVKNWELSQELVSAEREATTGRVAVGLAHDVGKELDWIRGLLRRLPEKLDDERRLRRDVAQLQDLADGLCEGIRGFVTRATARAQSHKARKLDEVVDGAVRRVSRFHGDGRVAQSVDAEARQVWVVEDLSRAIANLLDNALHAAPGGDPVKLFAGLVGEFLVLEIEDGGQGLRSGCTDDIFEPGVSTRLEAGGLGVGLTVAREIVREMGGSLVLSPNPARGMRATVRIPA